MLPYVFEFIEEMGLIVNPNTEATISKQILQRCQVFFRSVPRSEPTATSTAHWPLVYCSA